MKAIILAAGLGTRLSPITNKIPKPLFPVAGTPVIERLIFALEQAGCREIVVNTHHLADKIKKFLSGLDLEIPITTIYEPEILGTGGAIKNLQKQFCDEPFLVVNADIVSNIDFGRVFDFHASHDHAVTMVLYDCKQFNNVLLKDGFITGFDKNIGPGKLTFTGIALLDPIIFEYLEDNKFQSIIAAYEKMLKAGLKIRAYQPKNLMWRDIGAFENFSRACLETGARQVFSSIKFSSINKDASREKLQITPLSGGGSERAWYRIQTSQDSIVAVDHGVRADNSWNEADAYNAIGLHLKKAGVPVPKIYYYDSFSGQVFLEDLGDTSLEQVIISENPENALPYYEKIVTDLAHMAVHGAKNFDLAWTYQSKTYNEKLILEKESRYFIKAFINDYMGKAINFDDLKPEFELLAKNTIKHAQTGFLHRDFQSRNIMLKDGKPYFIDFQSARIGPLAYDLASLLIDPYTNIPETTQNQLINLYLQKLAKYMPVDKKTFLSNYNYCALSRNFQILGAFSHLSQKMKKPSFKQYIKPALKSLKKRVTNFNEAPMVQELVKNL